MRKFIFSVGAIVVAATVIFVWSHTALAPLHAGPASSVSPIDMMIHSQGPLPVERWDAI